ncbi:RNA recognition motif-containing protein [Dispira parvispora]|uniref:RNA recognition motif-containing protein n=1 Tax=Dispira parvispora TaxID=1520584 RepID=A0A9W8E059_9FUNG|nr:RNA recognition motif-containing protein [Dispira parvispora]
MFSLHRITKATFPLGRVPGLTSLPPFHFFRTKSTLTPRSTKTTKDGQPVTRSIYVANIPWKTKWTYLTALFSEFGPVHKVHMPRRDQGRGPIIGYAFITMNFDDAVKAVTNLDGFEFNGRPLSVSLQRSTPYVSMHYTNKPRVSISDAEAEEQFPYVKV